VLRREHLHVRTLLQDKQPDSELVDGVQVEILGIDPVQP